MPRLRLREKAEALVAEGRVAVNVPGRKYVVCGDHGQYDVEWRWGKWVCACDARGPCSHIAAVEIAEKMKEGERMATNMATKEHEQIVAAQTVAMTPQVARPEPMGAELDALWNISEKLARSSMFSRRAKRYVDGREQWVSEKGVPEDVFSIILAGRDFGLSAAAASRHLKMIKGALCISAEIMRARLHQFGYEYELNISPTMENFPLLDSQGRAVAQGSAPSFVTTVLWRRGNPAQKWEATYSIQEAVTAGLTKAGGGYQTNPEDMLIARATTRVTRRYAPEVLNKAYLPEEIGVEEQPDGQEGTRLVAVQVEGASPDLPPHDSETGEVLEGEYTAGAEAARPQEAAPQSPQASLSDEQPHGGPTPPPGPSKAPESPPVAKSPKRRTPHRKPAQNKEADTEVEPPPLRESLGHHEASPAPQGSLDPFNETPASAPPNTSCLPPDVPPEHEPTPEAAEMLVLARGLIESDTVPEEYAAHINDVGRCRMQLLAWGLGFEMHPAIFRALGYDEATTSWLSMEPAECLVALWLGERQLQAAAKGVQ